MGAGRTIIRSGLGGLVFGGVLYLAGDTASDMIVYNKLHSEAMQLVQADPDIVKIVGQPYTAGAWYDATLAFSHRDKVAHCTFQLKGSKGVTDIAVKAGRKAGYRSNILYNFMGSGVWQLISCQAMVPSEGGLVQPKSLMPDHQQQQQQGVQQGQRPASCDSCQLQQQQQQPHKSQAGQPAAAATTAVAGAESAAGGGQNRRWWQKLWRKRQPAHAEDQQT